MKFRICFFVFIVLFFNYLKAQNNTPSYSLDKRIVPNKILDTLKTINAEAILLFKNFQKVNLFDQSGVIQQKNNELLSNIEKNIEILDRINIQCDELYAEHQDNDFIYKIIYAKILKLQLLKINLKTLSKINISAKLSNDGSFGEKAASYAEKTENLNTKIINEINNSRVKFRILEPDNKNLNYQYLKLVFEFITTDGDLPNFKENADKLLTNDDLDYDEDKQELKKYVSAMLADYFLKINDFEKTQEELEKVRKTQDNQILQNWVDMFSQSFNSYKDKSSEYTLPFFIFPDEEYIDLYSYTVPIKKYTDIELTDIIFPKVAAPYNIFNPIILADSIENCWKELITVEKETIDSIFSAVDSVSFKIKSKTYFIDDLTSDLKSSVKKVQFTLYQNRYKKVTDILSKALFYKKSIDKLIDRNSKDIVLKTTRLKTALLICYISDNWDLFSKRYISFLVDEKKIFKDGVIKAINFYDNEPEFKNCKSRVKEYFNDIQSELTNSYVISGIADYYAYNLQPTEALKELNILSNRILNKNATINSVNIADYIEYCKNYVFLKSASYNDIDLSLNTLKSKGVFFQNNHYQYMLDFNRLDAKCNYNKIFPFISKIPYLPLIKKDKIVCSKPIIPLVINNFYVPTNDNIKTKYNFILPDIYNPNPIVNKKLFDDLKNRIVEGVGKEIRISLIEENDSKISEYEKKQFYTNYSVSEIPDSSNYKYHNDIIKSDTLNSLSTFYQNLFVKHNTNLDGILYLTTSSIQPLPNMNTTQKKVRIKICVSLSNKLNVKENKQNLITPIFSESRDLIIDLKSNSFTETSLCKIDTMIQQIANAFPLDSSSYQNNKIIDINDDLIKINMGQSAKIKKGMIGTVIKPDRDNPENFKNILNFQIIEVEKNTATARLIYDDADALFKKQVKNNCNFKMK